LHLQKAYAHLNYARGDFPVSENVASKIVSLPMFPQLMAEQQERVVEEVSRFVESEVAFKHASAKSAELEIVERRA
jgi:dTDP-4-amino-4,6-dideoxygalactose transaminase